MVFVGLGFAHFEWDSLLFSPSGSRLPGPFLPGLVSSWQHRNRPWVVSTMTLEQYQRGATVESREGEETVVTETGGLPVHSASGNGTGALSWGERLSQPLSTGFCGTHSKHSC